MFVLKRKIRRKIHELKELASHINSEISSIRINGYKIGNTDSFRKYNSEILERRNEVLNLESTIKTLTELL
jgi:hypothetical protein